MKRLSNETNPKVVKILFKMHLKALDTFLKQKGGLTKEEIELIADEVFTAYGHILSFADINIVFRNAKLGRYGELYNQLSCPKIMQWFDEYVDNRLNTGAEMSRRADAEKYGYDDGRYRSKRDMPQEDMRKAGDFLIWKDHYKRTGEI